MIRNCPVCDRQAFVRLFTKRNFILAQCRSCGLAAISGFTSQAVQKQYEYYKRRVDLSQKDLYDPITAARYAIVLKRLGGLCRGRELLDIGCGEGHFLKVAQDAGWRAQGIDITEAAVAICNKFGLNARCADIGSQELPGSSYDLVTMIEVIEHLCRPLEQLRVIRKIMKKDAVLYITTPNYNSLSRRLVGGKWSVFNAEHLFYFNSSTLKRILEKAGFKVLRLKTKNMALGELKRLFKEEKAAAINDFNSAIRARSEHSRGLSAAKVIANIFLRMTRLGESIECVCRKT